MGLCKARKIQVQAQYLNKLQVYNGTVMWQEIRNSLQSSMIQINHRQWKRIKMNNRLVAHQKLGVNLSRLGIFCKRKVRSSICWLFLLQKLYQQVAPELFLTCSKPLLHVGKQDRYIRPQQKGKWSGWPCSSGSGCPIEYRRSPLWNARCTGTGVDSGSTPPASCCPPISEAWACLARETFGGKRGERCHCCVISNIIIIPHLLHQGTSCMQWGKDMVHLGLD